MSDHLDRAAAIVGGCCSHCDDLVDERLALLDEAGLLRRPDDPEVHVEVTTQGSTCIVKVAGQVVFNGVGLEHALLTPSGVKRDAAVAALPLPVDGCACTPHEQSAGGVYTEYLLEYEPACPEHSEHLWDPTQGAWVLRSERDGRGLESWWEREPAPEPRTWALPEEPPVGTRLIGSDGDAWERDRDGWRWFSAVQRKWIETDEWIDILLVNGPFREATPDDLARLGIEDPS